MEARYESSAAGGAERGLTSPPSATDAAAEAFSGLIGSARLDDFAAAPKEVNDIAQPRARDAEIASTEATASEQETSLQSESSGETERAADNLQQWRLSPITAAQQHEGEPQGEEDAALLVSGVDCGEQETDDEDEVGRATPASASPAQQRLLDSQLLLEEEKDLLAVFGLEMGSLPSEAAIAALELLAADDEAALPPPASALGPSAVVQSLSLAQLDELLDFRSSLRASRRAQPAAAAGAPRAESRSSSSSRPSLAAALRSLQHVLAHPLPCPSLPSQRRGYQGATVSASQRSAGLSSSSSSSSSCRLPAYEQMAQHASSTSRLYSQLHAELADIQQAAAALAFAYPLDAVNAGLLRPDAATRAEAAALPAAADGAMAAVSRLKTVRKERADYISAEHSRNINRLTRQRQADREETAMQHLLLAVSHTAQA